MPSSRALSSLLPGFSPASRWVVLEVTEALTFPPRFFTSSMARSRGLKRWKLPVTHQT